MTRKPLMDVLLNTPETATNEPTRKRQAEQVKAIARGRSLRPERIRRVERRYSWFVVAAAVVGLTVFYFAHGVK